MISSSPLRALGSALVASALLVPGLGTPAMAQTTQTPANATIGSNDVRYSTILDYSGTNVLLSQGGFAATTTYDCVVATLNCIQKPQTETSLLPASLASIATTSSYKVSPDYAYALVTTYIPGGSPRVQLNAVSANALTVQSTLPALKGLVTGVRWTPDDRILLISESDGSTQTYNASTKTLTTLSVSIPAASWITVSPDGRYVAYYLPNTQGNNETRTFGVIDTVANKTFILTEPETYWDLLSEGVREFAFSPDSTKLLYLDDRSGNQTLYEVSLAQLSKSTSDASIKSALQGSMITSKPYQIADMQWLTNSSIVFSANRSNPLDWAWYTLNLNSYAVNEIIGGASYNAPIFWVGNEIVLQTIDANGRETRVYDPTANTLSSFPLPNASPLLASTNNQIVQEDGLYGVYLNPAAANANAATSTLVVWLHGGPDRQAAVEYNSYESYGGYDWVLNKLKAAGVPVLKLDYPGSVGYGLPFSEKVVGGVGTVDASSTMQAISDFAKAHGYSNVYLMGNSYGGYLALKLLVSYPKQISGVMSLSGVTDWNALLTAIPTSIFNIDFNGSPNAANAKLYAKSSVINNLSAITNQKIYVLQGNADSEVPYSQSTLLTNALAAAGKKFTYTTLQGEDHVYENASSYTTVCNQAFAMVGLATSTSCVMR